MPPKLTLEVAPDQVFYPNVRRRFVAHLNPSEISSGVMTVYASTVIPGSNLTFKQFVNADEDDLTFDLLLNEYGASSEDLSPNVGHMSVMDSLNWLSLAQQAIFKGDTPVSFSPAPVLLFTLGQNPVLEVLLISTRRKYVLFHPETLIPIRAEVNIVLSRYRKISL